MGFRKGISREEELFWTRHGGLFFLIEKEVEN